MMVGLASPYTLSVPIRFTRVAPGLCQARMREVRAIRNPFRSVHAAALVNLGEATGGIAMLTWCQAQATPHRAIVSAIACTFHKKARGLLLAQAKLASEDVCFSAHGEGVDEVGVEVVTEIREAATLDLVATTTTSWVVKRSPVPGV
jgi:acyl-coenzyme A thioesterase PaaI-like protein